MTVETWPRLGVGAVIWRGRSQLLLARRNKPPRMGEWSLPGGRVEVGETLREALAREVREETGLEIEIGPLVDVVDSITRTAEGGVAFHYVLADFTAHWRSGEARATSDVSDCRWAGPQDALRLVSWDETARIIRQSARQAWGVDL